MKVIAIKPVFYKSKLWAEGEVFELVEVKGFKQDSKNDKKLIPHTFTVDEQFSAISMKKLDVYEKEQEEISPKKRGRPFGTKVESNNLEVI